MEPHWRDTYQPARLGPIDARAGITFLGIALYFSWLTVIVAIAVCVFFWIAERRGLTIPASIRAIRCWLVGKRRPPVAVRRMRGAVDFQRQDI